MKYLRTLYLMVQYTSVPPTAIMYCWCWMWSVFQ